MNSRKEKRQIKPRMHSSRMRTTHFSGRLFLEVVSAQTGVSAQGCVSAQVCLPGAREVSGQKGCLPEGGGVFVVCHTPCGQTDTLCQSLFGGGN